MGHLTPVAAPRLACAFVPTNAQRRATAKRKLERQLERRAKQAKRRRILTIVGGSLAAVAVIVAVVVTVVVNKDDHQSTTSATPTDSASTSPRRPRPLPAAAVQAVGQPRRQLPVPAVAGQGRQTGQVAPDRQGTHRPGPGQREHGDQPGQHRSNAGQQRIAVYGQ